MIWRIDIRSLWVVAIVLGSSPAGLMAQPSPQTAGPLPDSVVAAREAQLLLRLRDEQSRTSPEPDSTQAQRRLETLITEAAQLASLTQQSSLRLECLSIQLQALYLRITRWPQDVGINDSLARLRETARQVKAVRHDDAMAVGDFWLVTAELWELKRSSIPLAEQQRQSEQVLRSFIVVHNQGPTVDAARAALRKLIDSGVREASTDPGDTDSEASRTPEPIGEPLYSLGEPVTTGTGEVRVPIRCRYQRGENVLRILVPDMGPKPGEPVRFLFLLPVEAGEGSDFGDPIEVVRKLDLHNRHRLVVVSPTFSDIPWYVDHPTDLKVRQTSYLIRGVLPAVRELFPTPSAHVLLLGFSKSGWGALSLLARYPREFDAAAVWDTPFNLTALSYPGMKEVFATPEYLARQALPDRLRGAARQLRRGKRIAILGYENFLEQQQQIHKLLNELEIPHDYVEGPSRRHRWDSGWVEQAVERLADMTPPVEESAISAP
jgi:hypothetical protein